MRDLGESFFEDGIFLESRSGRRGDKRGSHEGDMLFVTSVIQQMESPSKQLTRRLHGLVIKTPKARPGLLFMLFRNFQGRQPDEGSQSE